MIACDAKIEKNRESAGQISHTPHTISVDNQIGFISAKFIHTTLLFYLEIATYNKIAINTTAVASKSSTPAEWWCELDSTGRAPTAAATVAGEEAAAAGEELLPPMEPFQPGKLASSSAAVAGEMREEGEEHLGLMNEKVATYKGSNEYMPNCQPRENSRQMPPSDV